MCLSDCLTPAITCPQVSRAQIIRWLHSSLGTRQVYCFVRLLAIEFICDLLSLMPYFLIVADSELTGEPGQTVSVSYSTEIKWFLVRSDIDLDSFTFDASESFLEEDSFNEKLLEEYAMQPMPFVMGKASELTVGVVNEKGNVIWQSKVLDLDTRCLVKTSFEPKDIDWSLIRCELPREAVLIRYSSFEADSPELPLDADFSNGPGSPEDLRVLLTDGSSALHADQEVIGLQWMGKHLEIYGAGGSGYSPEYTFYSIHDGDIEEI